MRGALLAEYVAFAARRPWQPGKVDCCLFLADWAVFLGFQDPASHLRGRYSDEEGFKAIIARSGSLLAVVNECAGRLNCRQLDFPVAGAVGVIGSSSNASLQWGAIFSGRDWLVHSPTGIVGATARPLVIWEIPYAIAH